MRDYHDTEWGVPVRDDRKHFEFLTLESAQAGLSWSTVLAKRAAYCAAFADFDPQAVAEFGADDIEALMNNAGIIRNRLKIKSAVGNARCFLEVVSEFGSFSDYIWSFVDHAPIQNKWQKSAQLPAQTLISQKLSKAMKKRGFRFIGPIVIYSHMQATGLINDHLIGCFRHSECSELI